MAVVVHRRTKPGVTAGHIERVPGVEESARRAGFRASALQCLVKLNIVDHSSASDMQSIRNEENVEVASVVF